MHPRDFLDSYWRTTLRDEVFVAMPFHPEFEPVWRQAIHPAIEQDLEQKLRAVRVDISVLSGSVVTRILDGVAHSRLVLADISTCTEGRWAGQRNGNVMYEVGLAHAFRQSPEVVLIRSDREEINFDVAGSQVHHYDPVDREAARRLVATLLSRTLTEVDQRKSLQVQKTIDLLDVDAMEFIRTWGAHPGFHGPSPQNMGGALLSITKSAALARLQSLGVVRCDPQHETGTPAYYWTEFGCSVIKRLAS